jgi:hypothetical protein
MKKTLKLDATTPLQIHQNYKGRLIKGNELRLEINRRKINVCVNVMNKQQLIKISLENDRDVVIGQPDEDAIEREYAAEKNAEEEDLVDSEDDESPNLDDPAVLGNLCRSQHQYPPSLQSRLLICPPPLSRIQDALAS